MLLKERLSSLTLVYVALPLCVCVATANTLESLHNTTAPHYHHHHHHHLLTITPSYHPSQKYNTLSSPTLHYTNAITTIHPSLLTVTSTTSSIPSLHHHHHHHDVPIPHRPFISLRHVYPATTTTSLLSMTRLSDTHLPPVSCLHPCSTPVYLPAWLPSLLPSYIILV